MAQDFFPQCQMNHSFKRFAFTFMPHIRVNLGNTCEDLRQTVHGWETKDSRDLQSVRSARNPAINALKLDLRKVG